MDQDGIKVIFKIGIIILKLYEEKLLSMKFDAILHFLTEIGKHEIFMNIKYFAIKEGKYEGSGEENNQVILELTEEYEAIENISKLMNSTPLPRVILDSLERDYVLYELNFVKALNKIHSK